MTTTAASRECTEPSALPKSYEGLCARYLPRPIHTRADLKTASKHLSEIARLDKQTKGQRDYEDSLCLFIGEYETKHTPASPKLDPIALLDSLMDAHEMTQNALGEIIGAGAATVSKIMGRSRPIKPEEAAKLGERFKMQPAAFLGL